MSGKAYTIIGVLNPEFSYPFGQDLGSEVDIWLPAMMAGEAHARGNALFADRTAGAFSVIGRLKPGVSEAAAQTELNTILGQLATGHPESNRGWGVAVRNWARTKIQRLQGPLTVLLTGAAILLLVACLNLANLMLVRGHSRQRELAVRLPLGAGRRTLVRYLLIETLLLAAVGGILGVLVAMATLPALTEIVRGSLSITHTQIPPHSRIGIDGWVLAVAVGTSLTTGLAFGVLPALRVSGVDLRRSLISCGAHGSDLAGTGMRSGFVIIEIATATVLLAAASLLVGGLERIREVDVGFETERVLSIRMSLPTSRYSTDDALVKVTEQLRSSLTELPGVEWAATWGPGVPGVHAPSAALWPDGRVVAEPSDALQARLHAVAPASISLMGITLTAGREFSELIDEGTSRGVAVVSASLAARLWPHQDPLGRQVHRFTDAGPDTRVVVGIASDARLGGPLTVLEGVAAAYDLYVPASQLPLQEPYFLVRTRGTPRFEIVKRAVSAVDPAIPAYEAATLDQHLARQEGPTRFAALLMSAFALAALALAGLGVYGVLAFTVAQRRREIGVRGALGATPRDTLRLFLTLTVRIAVLGIAIGSIGAWMLGRALASLIVGVGGMELAALTPAGAALAAVAIAASVVPVTRAARVPVIEAIRDV